MSVWELVVAYLAIFVLLQFAIYRYLSRNDDDSPTRWGHVPNAEPGSQRDPSLDREPSGESTGLTDRPDDAHADVDGNARLCPNCGARNATDSMFRYCRHCTSPLGR